jgi:predicted RNA-binding Zn ribbon-like protein
MDRYHRSVSDTHSPAPRILLSFANTVRDPETDLLSTREEAAAWLAAADLLPAESRLSGSDHSALLRLRDSLRDVLAAHAGGREDADAAARLTRALADGRLVLTVDPASTIGLASAARASYSNTVALVAVAVAAADAAGTWRRLKACAAPGCGQAFYDDSATGAGTRCEGHSGR